MAASNTNRLLIIGALVFVVGVVLVLLVFAGLNDDDNDPAQLVTEQPTSQVQEPRSQQTRPPVLLPQPLAVPTDMEGVAIELTRIRGLVSVPIPGDLVSIYRLQDASTFLLEDPADPVSQPLLPSSAELLLSEIEVLGNAGGTETATFIIAVPPSEVAELLPLIEAKQLWFTLLPQPDEATESAA